MSGQNPRHNDSNILLSVLQSLFGWLLNIVGVCLVAGGVGTLLGVYLGLPFTLALVCGAVAIAVVLGVYLFLLSEL